MSEQQARTPPSSWGHQPSWERATSFTSARGRTPGVCPHLPVSRLPVCPHCLSTEAWTLWTAGARPQRTPGTKLTSISHLCDQVIKPGNLREQSFRVDCPRASRPSVTRPAAGKPCGVTEHSSRRGCFCVWCLPVSFESLVKFDVREGGWVPWMSSLLECVFMCRTVASQGFQCQRAGHRGRPAFKVLGWGRSALGEVSLGNADHTLLWDVYIRAMISGS